MCHIVVSFVERALDGVRVFFAPQRLQTVDDEVFHAPVPNRYLDGNICMGSFKFEITSTVPDKIREAVDFYLDSPFTNEIMESVNGHMPDFIRQRTPNDDAWFQGWSTIPDEELSQVKWRPFRKLAEVVNQALGRR